MLDALAPAALTMERLIAVLKSQREPKQRAAGEATLLGDLFDDDDINTQLKGTEKVDMGSINVALQFEKLQSSQEAHYSSLEWCVGGSKFALDPTTLSKAKENKQSCIKEQRARQAHIL